MVRNGLTALLNANGANGNSVLYVGQGDNTRENAGYIVKAGDTYWIISQKMNVDMNELLALNGANTGSVLYKGQSIKLPSSVKTHTVKQGETFWLISNAYGISMQSLMKANDASAGTVLYPGMVLYVPPVKGGAYTPPSRGGGQSTPPQQTPPPPGQKPYVTYTTHTVQIGDDFWSLGIKYGVPYREILDANGMNENSVIYEEQKLKIPVHHVPVKPTQGQITGTAGLVERGAVCVAHRCRCKDYRFLHGVSWNARRTVGANHADVEPLTVQDANTMKSIWGGSWSWSFPTGTGKKRKENSRFSQRNAHDVEYIKNNGFPGHFDVHFYNSTRHVDGKQDQDHQRNIKIAAGMN